MPRSTPPIPTRIPNSMAVIEPVSSGWLPRLTFTQGVLLGQLSMVILAVLFLRYVVFEDPDQAIKEKREAIANGGSNGGNTRKRPRMRTRDSTKKNNSATNAATNNINSDLSSLDEETRNEATKLLSSLSYDLASHSPESLDWLNVLIAQLLSSYRLLAANHSNGGALGLFEEALNRKVRPPPESTKDSFEDGVSSSAGLIGLDEIEVDEVELGEGFPQLSNARVRPSGNAGEGLRVELDLDYTDKVSLALSTRVVVNFPRPRFAVLPVSLSLTLQRFSGTVTVELPSASSSTAPPPPTTSPAASSPSHPQHPSIHLSLHPDFTLDLSTSSLLGSRAKLEDVPKVEQLLIARIRAAIQDRVVWPGRVEIALPGVSPHRHHHHHHARHPSRTSFAGDGEAEGEEVGGGDDWTVVDRPHPLACANENLPPTFSVSDFKHRNADSDSEDDEMNEGGVVPEEAIETDSSSTTSTGGGRKRRGGGDLGGGGGGVETPSVDLDDPSGPSISLHPKIRRRSQQPSFGEDEQHQRRPSNLARSNSTKKVNLTAPTGERRREVVRGELNVENLRNLEGGGRSERDSKKTKAQGGRGNKNRETSRTRGGEGLPASPTESFPGYFPAIARVGGATTPIMGGGRGRIAGSTGSGSVAGGGVRYRGVGGVGVGLSSR